MEAKQTDFKCFSSDNDKPHTLGSCRHRAMPTDGVWKMAPKHRRILEDARAKYEGLVWAARGSGRLENSKFASRYPKETKEFLEGDSDWQHGYNSGMLAAYRLVLGLLVEDMKTVDSIEIGEEAIYDSETDMEPPELFHVECALEFYPNLDS